jgi:peptidoglycan/LPS O-acetylase OafA/YrhL
VDLSKGNLVSSAGISSELAVSLGYGSAKQGEKYIIALDAMRFLAASLVMIFHLGFLFWASEVYHPGLGGFPVDYEWLAPFAASGWVGVEIFFVISGLVIVNSAEGATAFRFFRGRFLRLVPAVWICATITALILFLYGGGPFHGVELAQAWLKSVTFYPLDGWIDSSYWTLGVEISFYTLVFAVIACGAFHHIEAVIAWVGLASGSFCFLVVALRRVPVEYGGAWAAALDVELHQRLFVLALLRHGCFFALGAFISFARAGGITLGRAACLLTFISAGIVEIRSTTYDFNSQLPFAVQPIVPIAIWLSFLAATVAAVHWNDLLTAKCRRFARSLREIGLATYPLYLVHQYVGYVAIDVLRRSVGDLGALIMALTGAVGLAFVVSLWLEPMLRNTLRVSLDWLLAPRTDPRREGVAKKT